MMKKFILLAFVFFFPLITLAAVPRIIGGCQVDPITGNRYCNTSLASRYRGGNINYSSNASYRDTSDFYSLNQVCPKYSHFERYPINACVCNEGYEVGKDKIACVKKPQILPNEAFRVLMKAVSGQTLTLQEKNQKGAILSWLNDAFGR